jgi:hypothetical protein
MLNLDDIFNGKKKHIYKIFEFDVHFQNFQSLTSRLFSNGLLPLPTAAAAVLAVPLRVVVLVQLLKLALRAYSMRFKKM